MSREKELAGMLATIDAVVATCAALRVQVVAMTAADDRAAQPGASAMIRGRELGIADPTFRSACRRGEIEGARVIGREYRAPRSSIEAWIASRPVPKAPRAPAVAPSDDLDALLDRARGIAA